MTLYERYIQDLKERKERVESGKLNCIPISFPRFSQVFPGIEKRKYAIVSANQKVGKSKFSDKIYMYDPFFYAIAHQDVIRLKILYFTLEMGKQEKFYEFLCHLLWRRDKIRINPTSLKSIDRKHPLSDEILKLIQSDVYQKYIKLFDETVTFIDDIKNPTGIFKYCRDFAETKGHWEYKTITLKDGTIRQVRDYFKPDDDDEYLIIILDNYSNLSSENNMSKMQTIDTMSKYAIELRDYYNYHYVAIQHQAQAQESLENRKMNSVEPSSDGMADCKTTVRDANLVFGLFSPFKYGIKRWPDTADGYDITRFKSHIRFLKILENRDGESNVSTALYFDGAVSDFTELPKADNVFELQPFYDQIDKITLK